MTNPGTTIKFLLSACFIWLMHTPLTAQDDEQQLMKQLKGSKIVHQMYQEADTYHVLDAATQKWGLYGVIDSEETDKGMVFQVATYIPPVCDEIFWDKEMPVVIARQGKKIALITAFNEGLKTITPNFEYDDYRNKTKNGTVYLLVRKDQKWGVLDYKNPAQKPLIVFNTENEVPLKELTDDEQQRYQLAYGVKDAEKVIFDPDASSGCFKVKQSSAKWGMYRIEGNQAVNLVPCIYDSLEFIPKNGKFTIVYQAGKIGVYRLAGESYEGKQTVECEYKKWKISVQPNGKMYLALSDDGMWGWMDWFSGDEKTDFSSKSFETLPAPEFEQEETEE